MSELTRIKQQLDAAFNGGAWHGPSLSDTIDGVTATEAAARPVGQAHSIHELVAHISGWTDVIRRRVTGEAADEPVEGDWPVLATATDASWRAEVDRLTARYDALVAAIDTLDEGALDTAVAPGGSTIYQSLHGAIQHAIYHAGQIAILRKAASSGATGATA